MKISGFTIARNVIKYNYPILESIRSILPICDEFIINVGDSEDGTLELLQTLDDPKIRIIRSVWDMNSGATVLADETNRALAECSGDWAFYLQSDEVIHEKDHRPLLNCMHKYLHDDQVDALRLRWLHFYGSYYRYRIDYGWFQKSERIVKNSGQVESCGDAAGFRRKDQQRLRHRATSCLLYHYGWVHPEEIMTQRRVNAENIGFAKLRSEERIEKYSYGDLNRFPAYLGTHPKVMEERVAQHELSQADWRLINGKLWYHPFKWLRVRYKTSKRGKTAVQ